MRTVLQRVSSASVTVDGYTTGSIDKGILILLGIHNEDTEGALSWMCDKILKLRIFEDEDGKMNRSVMDVNGELLVVSQFTLYGDARKGTRPSFIEAARPEKAEPMYEQMIALLKERSTLKVESGVFGAFMDVQLVNDGPVTLILEK
jgi:D-tyrosyl-tRNA(Tyr) deacylase